MHRSARAFALLFAASCSPFASDADIAAEGARQDGAWEWCPAASPAAEVVEGSLWLQFSPDALYCTRVRETYDTEETIWEELAQKAQVRLVPSDNFFPLETGDHAVAMPVCARLAEGGGAGLPGDGTLTVEATEQLGQKHLTSRYQQPLEASFGETLSFRLVVAGYKDELERGLVLDGAPWQVRSPSVSMSLCGDADCSPEKTRLLESCEPVAQRRERWTASFRGGNVRFDLLTDSNGYEVVAAEMAEGSLDGEPFAVTGFFELASRATWPWSWSRDIAIKLPQGASGVCGLVLRQLYGNGGNALPARVISCDGSVEERTLYDANRQEETLAPPAE